MAGLVAHRCSWAEGSDALGEYHDHEWGRPAHDDRHLFELLILEGAQAGLSWSTILGKRENYRVALDGFDPTIVAGYGDDKILALLADPGIVRNRLKVRGAITNAQAFLATAANHGRFADYLWGWVGGAPVVNQPTGMGEVPARSDLSDAISKDLKRRGFTFVGTTIVYAYLQAVGVVDDHLVGCPAKPAGRSSTGG
jgi:DNA-3-methyladenine glycosylase I